MFRFPRIFSPLASSSRHFRSQRPSSWTHLASQHFVRTVATDIRSESRRRRSNMPYLVILWIFPAFTFYLGVWQVQRLGWKLDLLDKLDASLRDAPALLPDSLAGADSDELVFKKYITSGYFDHANEILLGPRPHEGTLGFSVITPLVRPGKDTIFVNRGFIDRAFAAPESRPDSFVKGTVYVPLMVRKLPKRNMFSPDNQPDIGLWLFADPVEMAHWVEPHNAALGPIPPLIFDETYMGEYADMLTRKRTGVPVGAHEKISLPNNHAIYAFTWFGMSIVSSVMLYLLFKKKRVSLRKMRTFDV